MKKFTPEMAVQSARLDLVTNMPYYGSIFLKLDVHESDYNGTAWTNGNEIGYNLKYIETLTHEQIIGLFIHECLHVILKHHLRAAEGSVYQVYHKRFNYACDYALNPVIKRSKGMELHPAWLYEQKWDDDMAERIFNQLPEGEDDDLYGGMGDQPGEVLPWPGAGEGKPTSGQTGKPTKAEIDAESNKIDQWIRAAVFKATGAGKLTGEQERLVKKAMATTVVWEDELQVLVETLVKDDYTWSLPNMSYSSLDIYLPSMTGTSTVDMLFFVDTSGSLGPEQLSQIMGEVRAIIEVFDIRVIVVYWDTAFRGIEIFDSGDVLDPTWRLNSRGGGGTDFRDVWKWMDDNIDEYDIVPEAVVFFSDLECRSYPDTECELPLIWAQVPDMLNRFNHRYMQYLPDYGNHVTIPIYKNGR